MGWCEKMKLTAMLMSLLIISAVLSSPVQAIPESDIDQFRASVRMIFPFDDYSGNESRSIDLLAFHGHSTYFYIVFRSHVGDAPPYDDFYVRFQCFGDSVPTEFHTTDYDSWNTDGIISIGKYYSNELNVTYDNTTITSYERLCNFVSADDLDADNNALYTEYYVEIVPVLDIPVTTVNEFCADEYRSALIATLLESIYTVLESNVNFIYTIWIIFQILAVIFVVLGIPIILFMLIRWVIWRVSGFKLGEDRRTNG